MSPRVKVLGFAGSLRKGSYNRALLNVAVDMAPPAMEITVFDLISIPLFNQDVEDQDDPAPVKEFKEAIIRSDALLICTPEYNYSIPGVLKNALDWASRSDDIPSLYGKPVAVMGASNGMFGTARCQIALQNLFISCNMHPLATHKILIANAPQKFDASGRLTDATTRKSVQESLEALVRWTLILQQGQAALRKTLNGTG